MVERRGLKVLVKNYEELHFRVGVVVRLPLSGLNYWLDWTWFQLRRGTLQLGEGEQTVTER
jgi:hypothetical protein